MSTLSRTWVPEHPHEKERVGGHGDGHGCFETMRHQTSCDELIRLAGGGKYQSHKRDKEGRQPPPIILARKTDKTRT